MAFNILTFHENVSTVRLPSGRKLNVHNAFDLSLVFRGMNFRATPLISIWLLNSFMTEAVII